MHSTSETSLGVARLFCLCEPVPACCGTLPDLFSFIEVIYERVISSLLVRS